jgi:DNA-binding NtrC family response regulator
VGDPHDTEGLDDSGGALRVRAFTLTALEGDAAGTVHRSSGERVAIGSHDSNELVLGDATVSRFHCELIVEKAGVRVRDLGSRNGTLVDGVQVVEAFLRAGSVLRLGRAAVRFDLGLESHARPLSTQGSFGSLVGSSVAMRATYPLLEKAAAADATVLLEGETGTGKGAAARSIHEAGTRAARPFLVVDCSALSPSLLESELFGHEKGAFTGAEARRIGVFEEVAGGTIFLDEVGELPADLQPKLLRVLENREVRRVGQNVHRPVDFRLVAATNRDLRAEVNAGRFRPDLYFRLAVVKVTLPALRHRPEDLSALSRALLAGLGASREAQDALVTPELVARFRTAAWPGNVRELRNVLERLLVLGELEGLVEASPADPAIDPTLPYAEARRRALAAFERGYLAGLMALHKNKVAPAARAAGIAREYLHRLLGKIR